MERGDTPLGRYGGVRRVTYVIIVSGFTGDVLEYPMSFLCFDRLYFRVNNRHKRCYNEFQPVVTDFAARNFAKDVTHEVTLTNVYPTSTESVRSEF